MKHGKKHKKSSKSKKKSKKSDRKEKKQKMKEKLKREKVLKATQKSMPLVVSKEVVTVNQVQAAIATANDDDDEFCGPSIDLMNRAKCPETKAEYDHRQSKITRVVDPETGRIRLIKGDGEILEEIVTRDRHKQINQEATRSDGQTYQRNTVGAPRK